MDHIAQNGFAHSVPGRTYSHPQTEEKLRHLNLVLQAMRDINQLIIQETDRRRLITHTCRILVKTRSYYNVWVALLDGMGKLTMAAQAGLGKSFSAMRRRLRKGSLPQCARAALRESVPIVTADPASDCRDCPLAQEYGGRGGITARLEYAGRVYGLLCASIPLDLASDPEERTLFMETAQDIGLGLHKISLEEERRQAEQDVEKRVREITCLYTIADISERPGITQKELCQQVVQILPQSWQYPDIACARITIGGREFVTPNYREPAHRQSTELVVNGEMMGQVEVGYLGNPPTCDEGPFLKEEERLIEAVAEQLGRITEHAIAEEALRHSESRYRALFQSAGEAIFLCSADGTIISVNRACQALTGRSTDRLEGTDIRQLFSPSERDFLNRLITVETGGEDSAQVEEFRMVRSDGAEAIVRLTIAPLPGTDLPAALQVIALDVTEERRLRQNMQYYIGQITRAQEDERLRISRELHDDTAQTLAGLSRDLGLVISRSPGLPEAATARLDDLRRTVDAALEGVRRFSQDLRPSILDDLGLLPALEWLVSKLETEYGIKGKLILTGEPYRLLPEQELSVFRIVQEAFSNVRRHSGATAVDMTIDFGEDAVTVILSDNGRGFSVPSRASDLVRSGRLGIVGMRERARLISGTLIVQSDIGKGTTVTLRVPR